MCGIVGLAGGWPIKLLPQLNQTLEHRGPDDAGEFLDPQYDISLAVRQLSILDLEGGHQPMSNEDDLVWVVHNGEIYNSPELQKAQESRSRRGMIS